MLLSLRYKEREASAEECSGSDDAKKEEAGTSNGVPDAAFELFREQLKVKDEQIRQRNDFLRAMYESPATRLSSHTTTHLMSSNFALTTKISHANLRKKTSIQKYPGFTVTNWVSAFARLRHRVK